jgi:hypothetical protein
MNLNMNNPMNMGTVVDMDMNTDINFGYQNQRQKIALVYSLGQWIKFQWSLPGIFISNKSSKSNKIWWGYLSVFSLKF